MTVRYKWILFDADGTLFDYDQAEATALRQTFLEFGIDFAPGHSKAYRRINAQIWLDYEQGRIAQDVLRTRRFELLFEAVGVQADAGVFSARYLVRLGEQAVLVPSAEEVVKALYGRVGMVLITNGIKEVQRSRLQGSTLRNCFAGVVISDEVGVSKPDSRIFDVAFAKMGHPDRREVLIVGDSLTSDIKGGAAYGIDTCWFNPTQEPRTADVAIRYEIGALGELLDIVGVPPILASPAPQTRDRGTAPPGSRCPPL